MNHSNYIPITTCPVCDTLVWICKDWFSQKNRPQPIVCCPHGESVKRKLKSGVWDKPTKKPEKALKRIADAVMMAALIVMQRLAREDKG